MNPDYKNSILNVTASFLKHYGCETIYEPIKELESELRNGYNHVIYILLDGLGVNVLNSHLTSTDAFSRYLSKEITSVYPPTTVAATSSVLSGKAPYSSGYVGWVQYFKNEDTNNVIFLNEDYYTQQKNDDLKEKYLVYDSILKQINKQNPNIDTTAFFPSFVEGGSESFSEEIERVLLKTHNCDQSFNYVYWTEPDLTSHIKGIDSFEVANVIRKLNSDFEDLIDNITDDTLVVLIADHGLTNVEEIYWSDYQMLDSYLVRKPSIEPRCANFYVKPEFLDVFKNEFNKEFSDDYILLSKQEFLDEGYLGYGEKHPLLDDFLGDYLALATTNKLFIFSETKGYLGHHAGLTRDEMIVPLIIYSKQKSD